MSQLNENEQLNQLMEAVTAPAFRRSNAIQMMAMEPTAASVHESKGAPTEFSQWQIGHNDTFRPSGSTREKLPVGVYSFDRDPYGIFLNQVNVITDSLIELPNSANVRVLEGMRKFWSMQERYRTHGLLYKRGVLLWGPPGSGKTATIQLLSRELMASGGLVVLCQIPALTSEGLALLRRIEPERRLICILEDIDEMIGRYGEHELLALLDGENQVDNVVMIATTNYPELLGPRIINRPSRFDERILVGMPSLAAREAYIEKIAPQLTKPQRAKWTKDTEGLSVAHIRELAAAVLCLDQEYDEVLERLRSMRILPKERDGLNASAVGFNGRH